MKRKITCLFPASTLVEMLVVMIVSGVIFMALFDGVDLVRRYSLRLTKGLSSGNSLLDGFQRLDYLFQVSDSVRSSSGVFYFYWHGEQQATVEVRDSLMVCTRREQRDTLFREVESTREVMVEGEVSLVDSLGVYFLYRGTQRYFPFGLAKRSDRENENLIQEMEDKYNQEDRDELEW